jgi:hypothetical protein
VGSKRVSPIIFSCYSAFEKINQAVDHFLALLICCTIDWWPMCGLSAGCFG